VAGLPDRLVGTTRWEADEHGTWSTHDGTATWTLQYRPEATRVLVVGWTLHCVSPPVVVQEPLFAEDQLVRALRWATGYVMAVRANACARREATVLLDLPEDRNVRSI